MFSFWPRDESPKPSENEAPARPHHQAPGRKTAQQSKIKQREGTTQGNPLGQPGLEDQIVTDALLLEIKMASHTLAWVKNIREFGKFR